MTVVNHHNRFIVLLLGLCAVLSVAAQAPVYTCDFENESERAAWTLNPVANTAMKLANKWYFGAAAQFAPKGEYGLFISTDGLTPSYDASQTMFTVAVRSLSSVPKGEYNLYFDWKCAGKVGTKEGFYICWVPDSVKVNGATGVADIPSWVSTYCCHDSVFCGSSSWTTGKAQITHDGTPHKLVLVYFCSRGKAVAPAACVDNLELRAVNRCAAPASVSHTMQGDTVVLSWQGSASYYDLKCYDASTGSWFEQKHITKTTCLIPNMSEGVRFFILRAFCSDTTASDYVEYTPLIFHKGIRCIDYLDLRGSGCTCASGTYENPSATRGVIDYGYADWESRHTLHYMPDEYDEHTNYNVRTCPAGYLASVRLGHGRKGGGNHLGQSITYTYTVKDYSYSVLKIKYAVVLENGHTSDANPQFWLDVRCGGKMLSDSCGYAFFQANDGAQNGWREGADGWVYKDWSEHTIDLRSYVGKTLTISLATTDCSATIHTGYVYFVLDCENGDMQGGNCGEDTLSTTFTAPSGFDYVWYDPASPRDTLSRERTFTIAGMDTIEYCVNLINKKRASCWYTLTASGMPRIPRPSMTYMVRCQNEVTFQNLTSVWRRNIFREEGKQWFKTSDPVTYVRWDFGDGTSVETLDSLVTHTYPLTGGKYTVTLTASISNGECAVSKSFALEDLTDWSNYITHVDEHLCRSENPWGYSFNVPAEDGQIGTVPRVFYNDVDSVFRYRTNSECDSLCHLRLHFFDNGVLHDTLCAGNTYSFFGRSLTETGTYTESHASAAGCDSVLHLYVEPAVLVQVPETIQVCPEDGMVDIPLSRISGRMEGIRLRFDATAQQNGFSPEYAFDSTETTLSLPNPKGARPNVYTAQLYYSNPLCLFDPQTVYIEERYSSSIIVQLPGVLVLTNSKYNGGYEFDSYQWYRDGQKIANATRSNLSVKDEDLFHAFHIELVRTGETMPVCTCPIVYGQTAVEQVSVSGLSFPVQVWTAQGVRVGEVQSEDALNQLQTGFYILSDGKHTAKILR